MLLPYQTDWSIWSKVTFTNPYHNLHLLTRWAQSVCVITSAHSHRLIFTSLLFFPSLRSRAPCVTTHYRHYIYVTGGDRLLSMLLSLPLFVIKLRIVLVVILAVVVLSHKWNQARHGIILRHPLFEVVHLLSWLLDYLTFIYQKLQPSG
jgi:hypothetical protein